MIINEYTLDVHMRSIVYIIYAISHLLFIIYYYYKGTISPLNFTPTHYNTIKPYLYPL